jgi:hypothetical protein
MTIKEVSEKYDISQDTLRYYEKVGIIPKVPRNSSGIRNYGEQDIGWIKNAKCMRKAGVSIEALAEYVKLFMEGEDTLRARHDLLCNQRENLLKNKRQIEETLDLLNYKIARYEVAVETGELSWEE